MRALIVLLITFAMAPAFADESHHSESAKAALDQKERASKIRRAQYHGEVLHQLLSALEERPPLRELETITGATMKSGVGLSIEVSDDVDLRFDQQ